MDSGSDRQAWVESRTNRLTDILRDLVGIPSENRAPFGSELACQQYVAQVLRANGWNPLLYTPDQAPQLADHPLYWPGRDYTNRPNVAARLEGAGGGRSLILSAHIDTVPAGSQSWTHDPFGGEIEGNRLYGRGSCDMKCGVATNLFIIEALRELDIRLCGDLIFETVVDEEFGGVNGTLAGRMMGFNADAAVISEPSFLRVCPAQRGGRTVHIRFAAANEGILGAPSVSVIEQLRVFLESVASFAETRRASVRVHPLYAHLDNPVPVRVTRIHTAPWGTSEPTNIPSQCQLELFWEAMPGEMREDIDREFFSWLDGTVQAHPSIFAVKPEVTFPIRWLPGSAISPDEAIVQELRHCATEVTGSQPTVQGIEGPCDLFVFHQFNIPAVLWGARGGNLHNPDEYVEIDSVVEAAKVLATFVCRWCGVAR